MRERDEEQRNNGEMKNRREERREDGDDENEDDGDGDLHWSLSCRDSSLALGLWILKEWPLVTVPLCVLTHCENYFVSR